LSIECPNQCPIKREHGGILQERGAQRTADQQMTVINTNRGSAKA
jgi:hypothetical protein